MASYMVISGVMVSIINDSFDHLMAGQSGVKADWPRRLEVPGKTLKYFGNQLLNAMCLI